MGLALMWAWLGCGYGTRARDHWRSTALFTPLGSHSRVPYTTIMHAHNMEGRDLRNTQWSKWSEKRSTALFTPLGSHSRVPYTTIMHAHNMEGKDLRNTQWSKWSEKRSTALFTGVTTALFTPLGSHLRVPYNE